MKLGKLDIKVRKDGKPLLSVKKDDKRVFAIVKKEKTESGTKGKKIITGVVSGILASAIMTSCMLANTDIGKQNSNNKLESSTPTYSDKFDDQGQYVDLEFTTLKFGRKTFLTVDEEGLLDLIEKAMNEVDNEYVQNGCTPVFSENDSEYSRFTKEQILALLYTESTIRLIEIKDTKNGIFNVNNYERMFGIDEKFTVYYGPGMMNEETVNYLVEYDRRQVNNLPDTFDINGKQVKISYDNLNPYDYVLQSGAKTEREIKNAITECLALNVKCIYIYLNRIVKDNVKDGTHSNELNKLKSYTELRNLTTEDKQVAFALIAYNNGPGVTSRQMLDGTLFAKDEKGKYHANVEYASKVMAKSNEYLNSNELLS